MKTELARKLDEATISVARWASENEAELEGPKDVLQELYALLSTWRQATHAFLVHPDHAAEQSVREWTREERQALWDEYFRTDTGTLDGDRMLQEIFRLRLSR